MDSPATVVVMMLLITVTTSQLPGTSHCMVMSKSINVSDWCDGRIGQCQLIPQEGLDLLEPDDSFRHMVELDDSNYQETRRIMLNFHDDLSQKAVGDPGQSAVACGRPGVKYALCSPLGGARNPEKCDIHKRAGC
ncbi:hypothetical protein PS2_044838 [Malus domestica]